MILYTFGDGKEIVDLFGGKEKMSTFAIPLENVRLQGP